MHPNVTRNNISWLHFSWATQWRSQEFVPGGANHRGGGTDPSQ